MMRSFLSLMILLIESLARAYYSSYINYLPNTLNTPDT